MAEGEPHSPEALRGEGTWTAEQLRHYLLAMSFNTWEQDFCLAQADFPARIVLSAAWHETFEQLRQETAGDGDERWGLIGVTRRRDGVLISQPKSFVRGTPDYVDGEDTLQAMWEAEQQGISYVVGDVHTHPAVLQYGVGQFRLAMGTDNGFSAVNLYGCVSHRAAMAVKFLVGTSENRLVCRSRETECVQPGTTRDSFETYWHRYWVTRSFHASAMNIAIANRYKLVLYGGKPSNPLVRIFPQ